MPIKDLGFDLFDCHHHVGDVKAFMGDALPHEGPTTTDALAKEMSARIAIMDEGGVRQAVVIPGHGYPRPNGLADTRAINDRIATYRDMRTDRFPVAVGIAEPLYEDGRMLLHGITFGGHPVAAAIARRNIEIFEREGVLENVRANEPYIGELLDGIKQRVPIVGDVRGAGFFWALELVRDTSETRFSAEEREKLLRGFIAGRLLEEGLIARPDDRGDAVLHLAPPLISTRAELEEMAAKTEAVLADASTRFFVG